MYIKTDKTFSEYNFNLQSMNCIKMLVTVYTVLKFIQPNNPPLHSCTLANFPVFSTVVCHVIIL